MFMYGYAFLASIKNKKDKNLKASKFSNKMSDKKRAKGVYHPPIFVEPNPTEITYSFH